MDDGGRDKKAKGTKKCVIKRRINFNDYKDCLLHNETHHKDLRVKDMMYVLKKLIKLH